MEIGESVLCKQDDAYHAWEFAMATIAELLLLSNSEDQLVIADVAGPDEWNGNAITIFVGTGDVKNGHASDFQPRLRIGSMSALWVWDGHVDARAPEAQRVWDELWPEARDEEPRVVAVRLAQHIALRLNPPKAGRVERSWGEIWARMFAASVDALGCLESEYPWVLQTSYRDGAGHYVHFDPCGIQFQGFYLNQAGYISCNRVDRNEIEDRDSLNAFNIRDFIESGASRDEARDYLLSVIQPMIERIETRGFERER